MSTGLAGLAALLLSSVSGTVQAGHRTAATLLATGMVSQIRITPVAEQTFLQPPPLVIEPCDATHACTAQQFSEFNLKSWQLEVALRLPDGQGVVCLDGSPFDGSGERAECDGGDLLVHGKQHKFGCKLASPRQKHWVLRRIDSNSAPALSKTTNALSNSSAYKPYQFFPIRCFLRENHIQT